VAWALLCCHLNTDTQPDSTYSAAAANQEIVGRTNERENESSRQNDTAEIQVKTQNQTAKTNVFFNNVVSIDACPTLQRPHYSVTNALQDRAGDCVLYNSRCQCINMNRLSHYRVRSTTENAMFCHACYFKSTWLLSFILISILIILTCAWMSGLGLVLCQSHTLSVKCKEIMKCAYGSFSNYRGKWEAEFADKNGLILYSFKCKIIGNTDSNKVWHEIVRNVWKLMTKNKLSLFKSTITDLYTHPFFKTIHLKLDDSAYS